MALASLKENLRNNYSSRFRWPRSFFLQAPRGLQLFLFITTCPNYYRPTPVYPHCWHWSWYTRSTIRTLVWYCWVAHRSTFCVAVERTCPREEAPSSRHWAICPCSRPIFRTSTSAGKKGKKNCWLKKPFSSFSLERRRRTRFFRHDVHSAKKEEMVSCRQLVSYGICPLSGIKYTQVSQDPISHCSP